MKGRSFYFTNKRFEDLRLALDCAYQDRLGLVDCCKGSKKDLILANKQLESVIELIKFLDCEDLLKD